jgi:hypothetical protein
MRLDGTPVLIDFGASRAHGQGATVNLTSLISVGYSPFEQYGGAGRQGPWSDFYALAGTLYRVIAGSKPPDAIARQQGEPLTSAVEAGRGRYSEAFLSAIDRALALDPAQRPQTAAAFREMVQSGAPPAVSGQDATLLRSPPAATAARKRRGPLRWGLGAAGILVLAGALVLMQPEWREQLLPPFGAPPVADPGPEVVEPERPEAVAEEVDDDAAAEATASPAGEPQEPAGADAQPTAEAPPITVDEDAILAGLTVPGAVRDFRETQISSAMLAYVSNKTEFDTCRENGCAELMNLMAKVQEALEGYEWERGSLSGSIRVINPRRLESEECPFMLDLEEIVRLADEQRSQTRTYCTRNGFDRELQTAGEIEMPRG